MSWTYIDGRKLRIGMNIGHWPVNIIIQRVTDRSLSDNFSMQRIFRFVTVNKFFCQIFYPVLNVVSNYSFFISFLIMMKF